jgi:hypothetical protein
MNPNRIILTTCVSLALSAPVNAYAHEPTPADYQRAAEACAPYYADPTEQGCPGNVIEAALHPETWCTPPTTPACTNGPTPEQPLTSTGPVPPAPPPAPNITPSYEVGGTPGPVTDPAVTEYADTTSPPPTQTVTAAPSSRLPVPIDVPAWAVAQADANRQASL